MDIIGLRSTFFDIAYSLGGASNVDHTIILLEDIPDNVLTSTELEVRSELLKSYKTSAMYPSWEYLKERFNIQSNAPLRNIADLKSAVEHLIDSRLSDELKVKMSNTLNQTKGIGEFVDQATDLLQQYEGMEPKRTIEGMESIKVNYDFRRTTPLGLTTGMPEMDELTAGFQFGTVGTIAGFTSHGKSTISNNSAYLNALHGKKVAIVSLEIPKLLTQYILLSRHAAQMGFTDLHYNAIIRGTLTEAQYDVLFDKVQPDFLEKIAPNLVILETEDITDYSYRGFQKVYALLEEKLGGLDMVVWDHINQFLYVNGGFNETGNHYIKYLTDVSKSYTTKQGTLPFTLFVVQTNRGGYARAKSRDGSYDLTALSDFNEVERSSTYVMFIYADEHLRTSEQCKMQLVKHRLGQIMVQPDMYDINYPQSMIGNTYQIMVAGLPSDLSTDMGMDALAAFDDHSYNSEEDLVKFAGDDILKAMNVDVRKNTDAPDSPDTTPPPQTGNGEKTGDFF